MITILSEKTVTIEDMEFRHADIIISDGTDAYEWAVGGLPVEGDLQAILDSREAELWREASLSGKSLTLEEAAKEEEIRQAPLTARQWFKTHQAAIDFIRLTPAEQETQIDAMTTAQLKTLLKFVTVAVSALIKKEFLE